MVASFDDRLGQLRAAFVASLGGRLSGETASRVATVLFDGSSHGGGLSRAELAAVGTNPLGHLVAFDADQIQQFVFASERPQVSGGASRCLEIANERARDIGPGSRSPGAPPALLGCVYSAGGGGLFLAPADADAPRLVRETQAWLERLVPGLTFSVASVPVTGGDLARNDSTPIGGEPRYVVRRGVAGLLVRLGGLLRSEKDRRVAPRPVLGLPSEVPGRAAVRCPSCARRAPGKRRPRSDEEPWCDPCAELRDAYLDAGRASTSIRYDELAERSRATRKYLAFLAVDGNQIGSILSSLRSLREAAAFSHVVASTFEDVRRRAREAVAVVPATGGGFLDDDDSVSLLSGGDEVVLIVPAAAAWDVLRTALATVESQFAGRVREPAAAAAFAHNPTAAERLAGAGASAGLVISHATFPVRLLRRYANDLLKAAKRTLGVGARCSACSMMLTDASPLPALDLSASEWPPEVQRLTSTSHVERFVAEVRAAIACGLPRSLLQGLVSAGRAESEDRSQGAALSLANLFRYQLARHAELRSWWEKLGRNRSDDVRRWFEDDGRMRVRHLVDARALDPVFAEETP